MSYCSYDRGHTVRAVNGGDTAGGIGIYGSQAHRAGSRIYSVFVVCRS